MRETLQRSQTQQTLWAASSQSFGSSSSGFSAVLICPRRVGTTHRAGPASLVNILVWGSHPSSKKAWYVSCYSLKASDNIWCATTWALHSHPQPLALLSPDGNTQAHGNGCARRLLQPGTSAPTLCTAKPRAISRLVGEKTSGKKQATTANTPAWGCVGKCQWPPASLCNSPDKHDSAVWRATLFTWGPSWKGHFPKRTLKHWLLTWITSKITSELSTWIASNCGFPSLIRTPSLHSVFTFLKPKLKLQEKGISVLQVWEPMENTFTWWALTYNLDSMSLVGPFQIKIFRDFNERGGFQLVWSLPNIFDRSHLKVESSLKSPQTVALLHTDKNSASLLSDTFRETIRCCLKPSPREPQSKIWLENTA